MAARLQHHSRALFDDHFRAVPGLGVDIWAHHEEVGSYRYCVYLNPTDSATFATIVYFPLRRWISRKGAGTMRS